jgi:glycosyltransferase involved in cell wall biosynthesis
MNAHILHVFPSFAVGGISLRTVRVINYLGARARHTIISLDDVTAAADRIAVGIDFKLIPIRIDKSRYIRNLLNFHHLLKRINPGLLATYNWGAIEWAGVNCIGPTRRHIHFEAGFHEDEATRQFRRRIVARRIALAKSDAVVVPSRTLQRIALEIWRLPPARVKYVPDGIDVARFAGRRHDGAETGHSSAEIIIGTVAPLRPEKNLARLIEAFSLISIDPRFRLVIAGDGPERERLERLVARKALGGRVTFLGYVPAPEDILPTFDIFGLSSDTEQIPNAVLEAMAAALPVASVDVGDIREMVSPINRSFVVARDRADRLAVALRQLADDPHLRMHIGAENRTRVEEHFGQERMLREYEDLLLESAKII